MTRKGSEVLGFEKVPPVKVGDLVTCTECDGVGWVRRMQEQTGPLSLQQLGQGHKARTGLPVICPLCQGSRKVQVMAQ